MLPPRDAEELRKRDGLAGGFAPESVRVIGVGVPFGYRGRDQEGRGRNDAKYAAGLFLPPTIYSRDSVN